MLNVFNFRDTLIDEYRTFSRSFVRIEASDIRDEVERQYAEGRYWPEPLIQINPNYQRKGTVQQLASEGLLHRACGEIFQIGDTIVLNDGQRFVAWYVRNIHGQDANQTRYCITDGADDKQIDAIVIDEDAQAVYVVQGNFIGAQAVDAAPLREVLSSWVQLKNLAALQENANTGLKQRLTDLSAALDEMATTFTLS